MESPHFPPETISADHEPEVTDEFILDAMQHIRGYLDISTEYSRIIYHLAWRHTVERLKQGQGGIR